MKKTHLFWIIPLSILLGVCLGFYLISDYMNDKIDEINAVMEFRDALNELECALNDRAILMWELYENECPDVYRRIQTGEINLTKEIGRLEGERG